MVQTKKRTLSEATSSGAAAAASSSSTAPAKDPANLEEKMDALVKLLDSSTPKSDFCCNGVIENVPTIEIKAQGDKPALTLAYPIKTAAEGKALIERCEAAPFGRGTETVHDQSVRNGWQLTTDKFTIGGNDFTGLHGSSRGNSLLEKVRKALCPDCPTITSELNKLLVYEKGNHFAAHKDTMRSDRHFATLVVFLPSTYKGGDLVVRHAGAERRFNFSAGRTKASRTTCSWVAFYTDCEHEVEAVTSGYRVNLQYNLYFQEGQQRPAPPSTDVGTRITQLLDSILNDDEAKNDGRKRVAMILDHSYSEKSLQPHLLKGNDNALFSTLQLASSSYDVELKPIVVEISGYGYNDDETRAVRAFKELLNDRSPDFYMSIYDSSVVPDPEAQKAKYGIYSRKKLPGVEIAAFSGKSQSSKHGDVLFLQDSTIANKLSGLKAASQSAQPTGNEGCEFELQYKHAAVVVSPKGSAAAASSSTAGGSSSAAEEEGEE